MPFDMSIQQMAVVVCAFLLGALLDAVISGILLVRAERRNRQLRRRISALQFEADELAHRRPYEHEMDHGLEDGFAEMRDAGMRAMPSPVPAQQSPDAAYDYAESAPAAWDPPEDAEAFAEIPMQTGVSAGNHPGPHQGHDGAEQSVSPAGSQTGEQQSPTFATNEAAERFHREYLSPMEDVRNQVAQLRAQLHDSGDQ